MSPSAARIDVSAGTEHATGEQYPREMEAEAAPVLRDGSRDDDPGAPHKPNELPVGAGAPSAAADFYSSTFTAATFNAAAQEIGRSWLARLRDRARKAERHSLESAGVVTARAPRGEPYREFYRQELAFEWGDNWEWEADWLMGERRIREPMRFFSFEEHATGRRKFVASTYKEFWRRYRACAWDERHAYELIREGRPCHLYFDLEYAIAGNGHVDGGTATDALVGLVLEDLARHEGVGIPRPAVEGPCEGTSKKTTTVNDGQCHPAPESALELQPLAPEDVVLELESTSQKKFSRHLIFRLPGVAFANAAHAGHFVRRLWARITKERHTDPRCRLLFVNKEVKANKSGAGGIGERASEEPAGEVRIETNTPPAAADASRVDSAISEHLDTNISDGINILDEEPLAGGTEEEHAAPLAAPSIATVVHDTVPFVDLGVYTRNRAFRLYLSSKHGKKTRLLPTHRLWRYGGDRGARVPATAANESLFRASLVCNVDPGNRLIQYENVGQQGAYTGRVIQGYGVSGQGNSAGSRGAFRGSDNAGGFGCDGGTQCPCPETAAFVCRDFDGWSPPGCGGATVRSWAAFPDHAMVVLNMQGNRFCETVERAHKSNNVMFVVDFREGAYYQRCHDPECRGSRGCLRPLPGWLAEEAVVLGSLGERSEREQEAAPSTRWTPPKIESDDEDGFWAAAAVLPTVAPEEPPWQPPAIQEEDDDAFWNEAAALAK